MMTTEKMKNTGCFNCGSLAIGFDGLCHKCSCELEDRRDRAREDFLEAFYNGRMDK